MKPVEHMNLVNLADFKQVLYFGGKLMKIPLLIVTFIIVSCTGVLAAQWIKFFKEGDTQLYYDAGSYSCYKSLDRISGKTTGYTATVWTKTSQPDNSSTDNMVIWSLDCSGRKIDKEGRDYPDIYGEHIRPDSAEEKLYKRICPICKSSKYDH